MKSGIVFDMDGVLFDTERLSKESFLMVAKDIQLTEYDIHEIAADCVGLNRNDTATLFANKYPHLVFDEFWTRVHEQFHVLLEKDLPLKPGTREILAYLKENNWTVGLASSSTIKSVTNHLERSGLKEYFQVVIGGDMVEHSKPQPDIYLKACELLQIDPTTSYAVEDSKNGVTSAYRAGMKTIMIPDLLQPTDEMKQMLHKKFDSLFDFMEYLKQTL